VDGSVVESHCNLLQHLTSLFGIQQRKFSAETGAFRCCPHSPVRIIAWMFLHRLAALRDQFGDAGAFALAAAAACRSFAGCISMPPIPL